MSNMLMVNGPITKYLRQVCDCKDSHCLETISTNEVIIKDDKVIYSISIFTTVCSICKEPYEVYYDTTNCFLIKNIGEEDAKRKEETNSKGT